MVRCKNASNRAPPAAYKKPSSKKPGKVKDPGVPMGKGKEKVRFKEPEVEESSEEDDVEEEEGESSGAEKSDGEEENSGEASSEGEEDDEESDVASGEHEEAMESSDEESAEHDIAQKAALQKVVDMATTLLKSKKSVKNKMSSELYVNLVMADFYDHACGFNCNGDFFEEQIHISAALSISLFLLTLADSSPLVGSVLQLVATSRWVQYFSYHTDHILKQWTEDMALQSADYLSSSLQLKLASLLQT